MYEELPNNPLMTLQCEGSLGVGGSPDHYHREISSCQELSSESKGRSSVLNFKKVLSEVSNIYILVPQIKFLGETFSGDRISILPA